MGVHCSVDVSTERVHVVVHTVDVLLELPVVATGTEEAMEVEHVLERRRRLVDVGTNLRRRRRIGHRPHHRVAHVEPQRMDHEAQRRVLAVPDAEEVVVGEAVLLVEHGGDAQTGTAIAVGPRPVLAVAERDGLGHQPPMRLRRRRARDDGLGVGPVVERVEPDRDGAAQQVAGLRLRADAQDRTLRLLDEHPDAARFRVQQGRPHLGHQRVLDRLEFLLRRPPDPVTELLHGRES